MGPSIALEVVPLRSVCGPLMFQLRSIPELCSFMLQFCSIYLPFTFHLRSVYVPCMVNRKSFVFGRIAEISARYRRQNDRTGAPRLFCFHDGLKIKVQNSENFACLAYRAHGWLGQPKILNLDGHTPIHKGIHKGWRPPKAAATLCGGGAKRRLLYGWVCGD
mgnify:CR=1 FL=1